MERIAEAIIKRNIHIIENELDTINRIEIIYLIFLLVKLLTNALIDDNYCFICLKCIFKKTTLNFDFDEAYCILDMMNKNLHKYSYRIITLKYNNDLYIDRFYLSLQIFKKTDGYINKYFVDIVDNDIEKFKDIFLNKIQILIQAFDERKFINALKISPLILKNNTIPYDTWTDINSKEIVNRLSSMVLIFGMILLRNWNIIPILKSKFLTMHFDNQVEYSLICCKKLNMKLNQFKNDFFMHNNITSILSHIYNDDLDLLSINEDIMDNYILDEFEDEFNLEDNDDKHINYVISDKISNKLDIIKNIKTADNLMAKLITLKN